MASPRCSFGALPQGGDPSGSAEPDRLRLLGGEGRVPNGWRHLALDR